MAARCTKARFVVEGMGGGGACGGAGADACICVCVCARVCVCVTRSVYRRRYASKACLRSTVMWPTDL